MWITGCKTLLIASMSISAAMAQGMKPEGAGRLLLDPVERKLIELTRRPADQEPGRPTKSAAELLLEARRSLGLRPLPPEAQAPMLAVPASSIPGVSTEVSETPPLDRGPQTVQGWVLRAQGRSTVWVNGEPMYRFDQEGQVRKVLRERDLTVPISENRENLPGGLRLRPGETLADDSKTVKDVLPPGAVVVKHSSVGH